MNLWSKSGNGEKSGKKIVKFKKNTTIYLENVVSLYVAEFAAILL